MTANEKEGVKTTPGNKHRSSRERSHIPHMAEAEPTQEPARHKISEPASDHHSPSEKQQQQVDPSNSPEHAWTENVVHRISELTSPVTEYFEKQPPWAESFARTVSEFSASLFEGPAPREGKKESMAQKISGLASPILERFDKEHPVDATWKDRMTEKVSQFGIHGPLGFDNLSDHKTAVGVVTVLFLLVVRRLFLRSKQQRDNAPSPMRPRANSKDSPRKRSTSFDVLLGAGRKRANTEEAILLEESPPMAHGPDVASIEYETWTPPVKWSDASRALLPQKTKAKPKGKVILNIQDRTITSHGVHELSQFPIELLSLRIKPPKAGGVLELYVKETPKDEWMEHTFASAYEAAQFQQDLIACQVIGQSVRDMYEALELVHKGSLAHDGTECVLHDSESDDKKGAVAWDDAMRCFSGIPSLRDALDDVFRRREVVVEENSVPALVSQYLNKRLLLGPVDFFRLFCPILESKAFPKTDSDPERVEQWLARRKRVALAAMMVRDYVRARTVVNQGWNLELELPDDTLVKRLAYDDNAENVDWDSSAKNEYYEGTVSRDVRCEVHSAQHLKKRGSSIPSQYQAFSLVGSHVFQLPPRDQEHPLQHETDPVLALPSVKKLVEAHPELDFFVCGFFPEGPRIAFVQVFVRSLPRGVDPFFDNIIDRFMNGPVEVRQRKLEIFLQLGPGSKLSPMAWAALKTVSLLLSWTRKGEAQIPFEGGHDARTPFPGMRMSNYMETTHFGGSLQTDQSLPKNYVAVTAHTDSNKMNMAVRVLYERLEGGSLPACVVDFSYVLEGEEANELPERALGSIRMVHVDPTKVALPPSHSAEQRETMVELPTTRASVFGSAKDEFHSARDMPTIQEGFSTPARNSQLDSEPSATDVEHLVSQWDYWNPCVCTPEATIEEQAPVPADGTETERRKQSVLSRRKVQDKEGEPFQAGIDALRDILQGVTVPVRREQVSGPGGRTSSPSGSPSKGEDTVNIPVLYGLSTSDLRRFFIATKCDLKEAAIRVVQSAAWRGSTFPIDTKQCRIELQSGQFFQQGFDLSGNPVFYFQNKCMGPWRGNIDASVSAILHRLEISLVQMSRQKQDVKCTVVVLLGVPRRRKKKRKRQKDDDTETASAVESQDETQDGEEQSAVDDESNAEVSWNPFKRGVNPRVSPGEGYQVHSSNKMIERLVDVLSSNYPERLNKLLLVPGKGETSGGIFSHRKYIASHSTRAKVVHLSRPSELQRHISMNELVTIVGGDAEVLPAAFEC